MSTLTQIQSELHAPKGQYNKFGKYSYRSCEDILEAIKPLLIKHGCSVSISDKVLDCAMGSYVEATVMFGNKDGDAVVVSAQAGIEKAGGMALPQAFGSASSYARKYALNGLFLIDDTKDADATNEHGTVPKEPKKPTMTKQDAISKLAGAKTVDELVKAWKDLPVDLKQVEDVEALKNIRKAELTTK